MLLANFKKQRFLVLLISAQRLDLGLRLFETKTDFVPFSKNYAKDIVVLFEPIGNIFSSTHCSAYQIRFS